MRCKNNHEMGRYKKCTPDFSEKYFWQCSECGEFYEEKSIKQLEQELSDTELRRKDLLSSLQNVIKQRDELEQQKAELIEALKFIESEYQDDIDCEYGTMSTRSSLLQARNILQKYSEEK